MTTKQAKEVKAAYQGARNSIQDIARIYGVTVQEVLDLVGEGRAGRVHFGGDLIDPTEAGPNADMNYGKEVNIPFSLN